MARRNRELDDEEGGTYVKIDPRTIADISATCIWIFALWYVYNKSYNQGFNDGSKNERRRGRRR